MRIALDAMGGDLAPKATLEGAIAAVRDFKIELVLVGHRDVIVRELADYDVSGLPITIEHAPEVVTMDDSPLESVLGKPESSIHLALDLVKRGKADAFVSAGNSGAVMAAAMAILGNLPGVDRPAIASIVPSTGGLTLLIDAGANTEVKALNLVQFAVMGAVYWRRVHSVSNPRVGLLSNGEEASKGTELTRAAAAALLQMAVHINYIGYLEGRDINRSRADVVVTDGFTGNVTLKTMEGFASFLLGNLRGVFAGGLLQRLAYLLVRSRLARLRARLDPAEYGGAPLLGVNGVAIIAHGSSSARAIRNAIRAAANEALVRHVNSEIVDVLATTPASIMAAPSVSGKGIRGMLERMRVRLHHNRDGHVGRRPEGRPEKKPPGERAETPDQPEALEKKTGPEHIERVESEVPSQPALNNPPSLVRPLEAPSQSSRVDSAARADSADRNPVVEKAVTANGTAPASEPAHGGSSPAPLPAEPKPVH